MVCIVLYHRWYFITWTIFVISGLAFDASVVVIFRSDNRICDWIGNSVCLYIRRLSGSVPPDTQRSNLSGVVSVRERRMRTIALSMRKEQKRKRRPTLLIYAFFLFYKLIRSFGLLMSYSIFAVQTKIINPRNIVRINRPGLYKNYVDTLVY